MTGYEGPSGVGQLAIPVADLDRSIGFYRDVLGIRFLFRAPPGLAFSNADLRGSRWLGLTADGMFGAEPPLGSERMPALLGQSILDAWRTNQRVMAFLVESLPPTLWTAGLPGAPRRTVQRVAAHIHNARCRWVRTLGELQGVSAPPLVDAARISRRDLVPALRRSGRGIHDLLVLGLERGGTIPAPSSYVWRNLPLDVGHVLTYFVAHEAHHRGQIVMAARALGHRLPPTVVNGLWQWTTRSRETRRASR